MEQVLSTHTFLAHTQAMRSTVNTQSRTLSLKTDNSPDKIKLNSSQTSVGEDKVELSVQSIEKSKNSLPAKGSTQKTDTKPSSEAEMTAQELKDLRLFKQRDQEVRTHEHAHLFAAGQYSRGGASFSYAEGPDGNTYAVGGAVSIDVSGEATPEATILKMQTVRRAALAPQNPSAADRRIAVQASINESKARQELQQQLQEEILSLYMENPEGLPSNSLTNNMPPLPAPSYSSLTKNIAVYKEMSGEDM